MKASIHERAIMTLMTGISFVQGEEMNEVLKLASKLLGYEVYTHHMEERLFWDEVQCRVKPLFYDMLENMEKD